MTSPLNSWPQDKSLENALNMQSNNSNINSNPPIMMKSGKSKNGSFGSQYYSLQSISSATANVNDKSHVSVSNQLLAELQSELVKKDELVAENSRLARTLTLRESTFSQQESQWKSVLSSTQQELNNANTLLANRQKQGSETESRLKTLENSILYFFQQLPKSIKDQVDNYVSFSQVDQAKIDYVKAFQILRKLIDEEFQGTHLKKESFEKQGAKINQLEKHNLELEQSIKDLTKKNHDLKLKNESWEDQTRKLNANMADLQIQQVNLTKLNESLLKQSQNLETLIQSKHDALISAQKQINSEQLQSQQLSQKLEYAKNDKDVVTKRCQDMQQNLENIEKEMAILRQNHGSFKETEQVQKRQINTLMEDLKDQSNQNSVLRAKFEELNVAYSTAYSSLQDEMQKSLVISEAMTQYKQKAVELKSSILKYLKFQREKISSYRKRYGDQITSLERKNEKLSRALEKSVELIKGLQSVSYVSKQSGDKFGRVIGGWMQELQNDQDTKSRDDPQSQNQNDEVESSNAPTADLQNLDKLITLLVSPETVIKKPTRHDTNNPLPDPKSFKIELPFQFVNGNCASSLSAVVKDDLEDTIRLAMKAKRDLQSQLAEERQERDDIIAARKVQKDLEEKVKLQQMELQMKQDEIKKSSQTQQSQPPNTLPFVMQYPPINANTCLQPQMAPVPSSQPVTMQFYGSPVASSSINHNQNLYPAEDIFSEYSTSSLSEPLARLARIRTGITNLRDKVYQSSTPRGTH